MSHPMQLHTEQFEIGLNEMRDILQKNGYPKKLVESKIETFLKNDQKPPKKTLNHTITLDYNSHRVQKVISNLLKKMTKLVPDFTVNMSFRSVKLTKFFSSRAKPRKDATQTINCVYKFSCHCSSSYIGMSGRQVIERITEHFKPKEDGIYHHIIHCDIYKTKEKNHLKNSNKTPLWNRKKRDELKFEYFKSQFKIIQKNFGSYFERRNSESYHIKAERPDLNDQRDHLSFKLF